MNVQAIAVEPNHIDDHLTGSRKSLIVGFDTMKKRGLINDYWVMARTGYVKDSSNILIGVHYPSRAALEPCPFSAHPFMICQYLWQRSANRSLNSPAALRRRAWHAY